MKLKNIIHLLNTDEFYICVGDHIEEIRAYEDGSYAAIRKYFDHEVRSIVPDGHALDVNLYPLPGTNI